MGYDIHITRAAHWFESMNKPIHINEWKRITQEDPSLLMNGIAEVTLPNGSVMQYGNEGLTTWLNEEDEVYLDYRDGRIVVKNPDEEVITKMKEIAEKLEARVIGDEGEEY